MKKILICTKDLKSKGGVSNFYNEIISNWSHNNCEIKIHKIGSPSTVYDNRNNRIIGYIFDLFFQYIKFISELLKYRPDLIVINPSMIKLPLLRDSIYLVLARICSTNVITFIRGWRENFFDNIFFSYFFKIIYSFSTSFIVLAENFKKELATHFVSHRIDVLYTTYDDNFIINKKFNFQNFENKIEFVFISRISELKGVFEILTSFNNILNQGFSNFNLNFYGHFSDEKVKERVNLFLDENPYLKNNIHFNDFILKEKKYEVLANSEVFIFPSYMEGCPNAVIEAFASGCFVIASNVGAIPEIIEHNFNSIIVQPRNQIALELAILKYIHNRKIFLPNCQSNRAKSVKKFDVKIISNLFYHILNRPS